MARTLPLYTGSLAAAVETTPPLTIDKGCTRCPLSGGVKNPCLPADGKPGGLLVVGDAPGREEDQRARPFVGLVGNYLRKMVADHWKGPVVFDNATRCFPPPAQKDKVAAKAIAGCRPYLAQTVIEVQPTRVIVMGAWAMHGILGRGVAPLSVRSGYAYLGSGAPVFMLMHPAMAYRNRFLRSWFEHDFRWALTANPPKPPTGGQVFLVESRADCEAMVRKLRTFEQVAFDVESMGVLYEPGFRIVAFAACGVGTVDSFVLTRGACMDPVIRQPLVDWLMDSSRKKLGQNVKYDVAAIWEAWGICPQGVDVDVRLWRKLLEPAASAKLADMAELIGMGGHKHEAEEAMAIAEKGIKRRLVWERAQARKAAAPPRAPGAKAPAPSKVAEPPTLAQQGVPPELEHVVRNTEVRSKTWSYGLLPGPTLYRYNGRDAVSTAMLAEAFQAKIEAAPEYKRIWERVIVEANRALPYVERWGVKVNERSLEMFDKHLDLLEHDALGKLSTHATGINWASPAQVANFFFRTLGLPAPKVNEETGAESVDKEVLQILSPLHPAAAALIDYRRAAKLRGTYAAGMRRHVRADGRVHPSIMLDGAETGRTACRDPNLQNIPRPRTTEGKMSRDIFIAARGMRLLQLDYSQLELRIAALLSGDQLMNQVFLSGVDYHQRTAEMISQLAWHIPPSEVQKKHRDAAKIVNFGLLYGKTDGGLAEELNIRKDQAAAIRAGILGNFKGLAAWCAARLKESRFSGESWTYWDGERARRRSLWRIGDPDDGLRVNAENSAVNSPIQGTASDYCVASMAAVVQWILDEGVPAKVGLTVHDSILLEVEECAVSEVADKVQQIMSGWPSGSVPLVVDVEEGDAWGSLSKRSASPAQTSA